MSRRETKVSFCDICILLSQSVVNFSNKQKNYIVAKFNRELCMIRSPGLFTTLPINFDARDS